MRHAVYVPPIGSFGDARILMDLAVAAEETGWDGFFLWDHIQYEHPVPLADAWTVLAAIATSTSTIRLGPLVTPLPRRRPWKVAREAVTLDHLSAGRLVLGVGLGIDYWREFNAFSGEAEDDSERARLLDDGIEIIKRLWTTEPVSHQGRRLSVDGAHFVPGPVQQPRIPIWSAALWPPSKPGPLARALRCDGVVPFTGAAMTPAEAAAVRQAVTDAGRDDDGFELCLWGRADQAEQYEEAGVTWLMHSVLPETPLADLQASIAAGPPSAD